MLMIKIISVLQWMYSCICHNVAYYLHVCLIILQYGRTPLCWAAANGLSDVAQLLINKGASINVIDKVSIVLNN